MRIVKKYSVIFVFLAVLLGILVDIYYATNQETPADFLSVQMESPGAEVIRGWSSGTDEVIFFLPYYAQLESLRITADTRDTVLLGGQPLEGEMSCAVFQWDVPYTLTRSSWRGDTEEISVMFLRSSEMPAMYIDTQSGSMNYIHGTRGNEEKGRIRLYQPDGTLDYFGEVNSFSGRGNSTWDQYEKKPYDLRLELTGNLLGMGEAENWILLANASDASHMRNKIVYDFAAQAQLSYSPESKWVELYLNGTYAGLYLLCEKNEIQTERIDIGSDGTFLVSQEAEDRLLSKKIPYIKTKNGHVLRIREANIPVEEVEAIWQSAENAILSKDGYDGVGGKAWDEWIDMDSWARKYLIEELFGNIDAGFSSEYFYYSPEKSKICAGPVWDYDYAMYDANAIFAKRAYVRAGVPTLWYSSLLEKPVFQSYVEQLYIQEFVPLTEQVIHEEIDRYRKLIQASARMDSIRWNREPEDFQVSADGLKTYFAERISFLTGAWIDGQPYFYVKVDNRLGRNITIYALKPGENLEQTLAELTGSADILLGWYDLETNEKIDISKPVDRDMDIYASWSVMGMGRYFLLLLPIVLIGVLFLAVLAMDLKRSKGRWRK